MSSIHPYYDIAYPNHAAEQAHMPYSPPPVEQVRETATSRAGESSLRRPDPENSPGDVAVLSESIRLRAERQPSDNAPAPVFLAADQVLALDPDATRRNRALQEFLRSLEIRNNRAALARYIAWLDLFTRYQMPIPGNLPNPSDRDNPLAGLRYETPGNYIAPPDTSVLQDQIIEAQRLAYLQRENAYYDYLGISRADNITMEMRENMAVNIDRWYLGEGVFMPQMLWYSDSSGFRFAPITPRAQEATRAPDVLASHSRPQIAGFLREMAGLTPFEFLFYDPTFLAELTLEARRQFLQRAQTALDQAGVRARAADLRYAFDREGMLLLDLLGLQRERDRLALDRFRADLSNYYGQLADSVRQYDEGIISGSLV